MSKQQEELSAAQKRQQEQIAAIQHIQLITRNTRLNVENEDVNPVQDHYAVLGISSTATSSEIKKASRKQALLVHPDKSSNLPAEFKEQASEAFRKVTAAKETLLDAKSRPEYDADVAQQASSTPEKSPSVKEETPQQSSYKSTSNKATFVEVQPAVFMMFAANQQQAVLARQLLLIVLQIQLQQQLAQLIAMQQIVGAMTSSSFFLPLQTNNSMLFSPLVPEAKETTLPSPTVSCH